MARRPSETRPGLAEVVAPHHLGHRERAHERFDAVGGDPLADYELLEILLFQSLPRRDTKPIAKALIARFGNFAGVLGAPRHLLEEVEGIGPSVSRNLKVALAAAQRMARQQVAPDLPVLNSWQSLVDYCRAQMAFEPIEQFRILFLDKKNKLIRDEVQQKGTVDHTPVYPREVIKRSLELSATALILVHNHPSGDPSPSAADVQMTRAIADVARPLGIVVHDHIIIGRAGHVSMKAQKLF